tara:strand:+ start:1262 stop:2131 length:870 start_codon:yes stop_codon:yes gene_type:complete
MSIVTVNLIDTFDEWRIKTNTVATQGGDLATLSTTDKTSLVNAINELETQNSIENVVEDLSPELGNDLNLNTHDIVGTGNINITGSYTGTLTSTVTGVTQSVGDNSTKLATTEYVVNSFAAIPIGGDLFGTVGNAQIAMDAVGIGQLDVSDGNNGDILSTDGNGSLAFITADLTLGGDLSGTLSTAQIASNTIGINELYLSDGADGQVLQTDGAGTISFTSVMTETTITPTAGQTLFPIAYMVGRIAVFLNGIKLVNGTDFTASNGTDVSLIGGLPLETVDRIEFHVFC